MPATCGWRCRSGRGAGTGEDGVQLFQEFLELRAFADGGDVGVVEIGAELGGGNLRQAGRVDS